MDSSNFQYTSDPDLVEKVERLKEVRGNIAVEMFNGITYRGSVTGMYFAGKGSSGRPDERGGYIVVNTKTQNVRLDALDIKSWTIG